jgi:hypothetical protein
LNDGNPTAIDFSDLAPLLAATPRTPEQVAHMVAYLLDPQSPINK